MKQANITIETDKAVYKCTPVVTGKSRYMVFFKPHESTVTGYLFFDNSAPTYIVQWLLEFDKTTIFI